ncbi:MAG: amidohydrolase family protein [Eubacteriales bacterium]|nr:amidohydrolase family protein [Eubacteriales bacterium]
MLDILIKNAKIVDGTGSTPFLGSVGIEKEKIVLVKKGDSDFEAESVVDGAGLICCPGFIDIHSHADMSINIYPETYNLLVQGITTFIGGNCGSSLAPAKNPEYYKPYYKSIGLEDDEVPWTNFEKWLDQVETLSIGANYVPLVGHNAIRGSAMGADYKRISTRDEITEEIALLNEALDSGAFGMSVGFDAGMPGHTSDRTELDPLFAVLEKNNSLLTAHTRHHQNQWPSDDGRSYYGVYNGYRGDVLCGRYHGFIEFMEYYKRFPKLRTLIAHLTNAFLMPQPHGQALEDAMVDETIEQLVNEPLRQGYDLYYNLIPSELSISSRYRVAFSLIQSFRYDNYFCDFASESALISGIQEEGFRLRLIDLINSGRFKVGMLNPATDPYWSDAYTFVRCGDSSVAGKTLMELTNERNPGTRMELVYRNCIETLLDLLIEYPDTEWALTKDKREFMAYERLLLHPRSMPISDCIAFPEVPVTSRNIMSYGTPPIAYTIMCRYLINMVRDKHHLTLEEALRRITSLPAQIMGIYKRGSLTGGYFADVVLFDLDKLGYENDFLNPAKRPSGFKHVIVNGKFAMKDGRMQSERAGKVLRKMNT